MYNNVFTEGSIGKVKIKNRLVMPAMGTHHADQNHKVTQTMIDYYTARAKGGFGLIITEYSCVDPEGLATLDQLGSYSDDMIEGLASLANSVHEADAKIFLQLQHSGRETSPDVTGKQTVAPSAIPSPLFGNMPRELSIGEIKKIVENFSDAALRAKKAGFDGVEVQMGHGYLLGEFFSPAVNKRTDAYGANITGRMRIGLEVVKSIKDKCGEDFPVSCRISGDECYEGGNTIEDSIVYSKALQQAGADAIHVSVGGMPSLEHMVVPTNVPCGFNNNNIRTIKKAIDIPVIGVGKINEVSMADSLIENNDADFIAMGRSSIADPNLPNKAKNGHDDEITPCVGCLTRCWGEAGLKNDRWISCMMNPFAGYEGEMKITSTSKPKNIVVIGGGPGGLEAAWIAACRGHKVTLLEKKPYLGGQLKIASVAPGKNDFGKAIKWFITMCNKYGVEIKLSSEATFEKVKELNPDEIILSTGANAAKLNLNVEDIPIVTAFDVLESKCLLGNNVLVLGGGMVGLETAEYALSLGKKATVVEMLDHVGNGISGAHLYYIMKNLKYASILTSTKFISANKDGVFCQDLNGEISVKGIDMIVTAVGTKSNNELYESLKELNVPVHMIGDAVKTGRAFTAIEQAARLALDL